MPIEVETYEPSALSGEGNCGVHDTVRISGKQVIMIRGQDLESFRYEYSLRYMRVQGCHMTHTREGSLPAGSPGRASITYGPYSNPVDTDLGNGLMKREYYIWLTVNLQDYCGICYNPQNVKITTINENATTLDPNGVTDSQMGFFSLMRLLERLPGKKGGVRNGGRVSIPEGRRAVRDISRAFDLYPHMDIPADACSTDIQSNCDLTP